MSDSPTDARGDDVTDVADVPVDTHVMCTTDRECADGLFCSGIERCMPGAAGADSRGCVAAAMGPCGTSPCNETTRDCQVACPPPSGSIGTCTMDADCDDHVVCNGAETCTDGYCYHSAPLTCLPGQFCVESMGGCVAMCSTAADCSDGMWCNGAERCVAGLCQPATSIPCPSVAQCDETMDQCTACTTDAHCDDGRYCDGRELCGPSGTCIRNLLVPCTSRPCFEDTDSCGCATDANCDDGRYCTGRETCSGGMCVAGRAPCPQFVYGTSTPLCNETTDTCPSPVVRCTVDNDCRDGRYCNGVERCMPSAPGADAWGCIPGPSPCTAGQTCDETMQRCISPPCPDGDGDGHRDSNCGGDDCDDFDMNRFPGNPERCAAGGETHDEDCDPTTVGSSTANDTDHDGVITSACCNSFAGTALTCGTDCDDTRANVFPAAPETCDGIDNNCNGMVDEGVTITGYLDSDSDGLGTHLCARPWCAGTPGFVANDNDCNDTDPSATARSQQCGSGSDGTEVWICADHGVWTRSSCSGGQMCFSEPNGTGSCR